MLFEPLHGLSSVVNGGASLLVQMTASGLTAAEEGEPSLAASAWLSAEEAACFTLGLSTQSVGSRGGKKCFSQVP